ncbi:polysaccharide deacetylase family protein [Salipaludibacillus sp. HK11]|uniref:polysaccharide deacetylase family protein n=1 Tax=Salipaludibacillus sp. HK11 TaxID=3394320 RepID=UPI0039FCF55F
MRRAKYISVALTLAIFLNACGNDEETESPENDNESEIIQEEEDENNEGNESANDNENQAIDDLNENNDLVGNNNDVNDEVNEEREENEEIAVEDLDPAYEIGEINGVNYPIRPIDDANEEVVLLTIDDAPDNHGPEMAHILKDLDAGAIFFVNGHFINTDEGKEDLKEIHDLGFEIGNHTMSHPNLNDISEEEQYEEIVHLNDLIEEIIGERPRFFRAPFGANTDYSKKLLEEEGMQWMNWSYGYDWEADYMEKEALEEIMVETELLGNGANLLMHDREFTKDALPGIVEGLREKGYEIVDPALIK